MRDVARSVLEKPCRLIVVDMNYRALHADFEDAYQSARNKKTLALLAGVSYTRLSGLMNSAMPPTPQNVARLTNLAAALNYTGPLFADEVAE